MNASRRCGRQASIVGRENNQADEGHQLDGGQVLGDVLTVETGCASLWVSAWRCECGQEVRGSCCTGCWLHEVGEGCTRCLGRCPGVYRHIWLRRPCQAAVWRSLGHKGRESRATGSRREPCWYLRKVRKVREEGRCLRVVVCPQSVAAASPGRDWSPLTLTLSTVFTLQSPTYIYTRE